MSVKNLIYYSGKLDLNRVSICKFARGLFLCKVCNSSRHLCTLSYGDQKPKDILNLGLCILMFSIFYILLCGCCDYQITCDVCFISFSTTTIATTVAATIMTIFSDILFLCVIIFSKVLVISLNP